MVKPALNHFPFIFCLLALLFSSTNKFHTPQFFSAFTLICFFVLLTAFSCGPIPIIIIIITINQIKYVLRHLFHERERKRGIWRPLMHANHTTQSPNGNFSEENTFLSINDFLKTYQIESKRKKFDCFQKCLFYNWNQLNELNWNRKIFRTLNTTLKVFWLVSKLYWLDYGKKSTGDVAWVRVLLKIFRCFDAYG